MNKLREILQKVDNNMEKAQNKRLGNNVIIIDDIGDGPFQNFYELFEKHVPQDIKDLIFKELSEKL